MPHLSGRGAVKQKHSGLCLLHILQRKSQLPLAEFCTFIFMVCLSRGCLPIMEKRVYFFQLGVWEEAARGGEPGRQSGPGAAPFPVSLVKATVSVTTFLPSPSGELLIRPSRLLHTVWDSHERCLLGCFYCSTLLFNYQTISTTRPGLSSLMMLVAGNGDKMITNLCCVQ